MNFTIERAAFLTAAKRAAQLAPSASPLEALKCALLEIDTGTRSLHMTATNMEVTLRQDVPLLAYEGGDTTFAIDAKLLSAMLANLPGNTVECCKGDKDTLALSSDHAYYQVPTASGKGFPRMNITAPESVVKLSGVPSMVRRAAFATDPNNSNMPLLRCVNLRLTSDGLRAVGSDGVCIVSAKGDKQCTGDQTFLIPAANLEKLAQLCSMWKLIERELPETHITAHILRHTYITRLFEAGLDVKEIQYLAGHSTMDMTLSVYTHYDRKNREQQTGGCGTVFPEPETAAYGISGLWRCPYLQ